MGCQLVLFYILFTISVLVESFPYPSGVRLGTRQPAVQSNVPAYYQPSQLWANQVIPQSTQSPFVWNNKQYEDINIKQQNEGSNLQSFVTPGNVFDKGQKADSLSYDSVTPVATLNGYYPHWPNVMLPQTSTAAPFNSNNGLSGAWWNNQELSGQKNYYGQPYEADNFINGKQGNYDQGYSQYQSAGLVTPTPVNFGQTWLPQNPYNVISTPNPVEYLPWPTSDDEKKQPMESNSQNEYNIPAIENKPNEDLEISSGPVQPDDQQSIIASQPPVNNQLIISKPYIIVHLNGTYEQVDNLDDIETDQFNIARIKTKEPPENIITAIYEVEDLSEIENHSSLEVPYDTGIMNIPRELDWSSNNSEYPGTILRNEYTNFTHVTTADTTHFDMNYFNPEYIMPIQSTIENTIDSTTTSVPQTANIYGNTDTGRSSFLTQSTTENAIISNDGGNTYSTSVSSTDIVTDSNNENIGSTTDRNFDGSNRSGIVNFNNNIITPSVESITNSTTDIKIESTTEKNIVITKHSSIEGVEDKTTVISNAYINNKLSNISQNSTENTYYQTQKMNYPHKVTDIIHKYYDYEDVDYKKEMKYNNENGNSSKVRDTKENYVDDLKTVHSSNSPKWIFSERGNEYDQPSNQDEPKQLSNEDKDDSNLQSGQSVPASASNVATDKENDKYPGKHDPPTNDKQNKPRDDLKIDVSELKTTVNRPVVWFRPDKTLWDKVTRGEQSFDAVSIYNVKCKPKLIERVTTIHHYLNGTELVDYAEIIWDSLDAVNPREIRSKREFREQEKPCFD